MKNPQHFRVLAIAPSTFGIGFAVMEGENTLVNWGTKRAKSNKNTRCLSHAGNLMAHYKPNAVVVEDTHAQESRRSSRIQALIEDIAIMAKDANITVMRFSPKQVKLGFLSTEQGTKHDLAEHLARRFPDDLECQLPPKRQVGDSETYRMDIFDAVGLAQHCLRSKGQS